MLPEPLATVQSHQTVAAVAYRRRRSPCSAGNPQAGLPNPVQDHLQVPIDVLLLLPLLPPTPPVTAGAGLRRPPPPLFPQIGQGPKLRRK